jgi:hypothetical protein
MLRVASHLWVFDVVCCGVEWSNMQNTLRCMYMSSEYIFAYDEDGNITGVFVPSGGEVNPTTLLNELTLSFLQVSNIVTEQYFGMGKTKFDKLRTFLNASGLILTEEEAATLVDNYTPGVKPIGIANVSGYIVTLPEYDETRNVFLPTVSRVTYYIDGLPITSDNNPFILTYNGVEYGLNSFISFGGCILLSPAGGSGVPCFTGDVKILTPHGYVPISKLKMGSTILTSSKRKVKVSRIRKFIVAANKHTLPCIVPVGKFGCRMRLLVSPDHKIQIKADGTMARAATLGFRRASLHGNITYYNIELPDYYRDKMIANGVIVESLFNPQRHLRHLRPV